MYNNQPISGDRAHLEGQRPYSEWNTSRTAETLHSGIDLLLPEDVKATFFAAWSQEEGSFDLGDYRYRDVPIYDGSRLYLSRSHGNTFTGYAFLRGIGDGLPLPPVGSYVIPVFRDHNHREAAHNIRRVENHEGDYILLDEHEGDYRTARAWLEMPTGWRPSTVTSDEETRPLRVGDVVRLRDPLAWQSARSEAEAAAFRGVVTNIYGNRVSITPTTNRPDGYGSSPFEWDVNDWTRVEQAEQNEERAGGKTAAEWQAQWEEFWAKARDRAINHGYSRAFEELAEEFGIEAHPVRSLNVTFSIEVNPRQVFGSRATPTAANVRSHLERALAVIEGADTSTLSLHAFSWND